MGISINNPLGSVIDLIKDGLDRFIPDKTAAAQEKATLDQLKETDEAKARDSDLQVQLAGLGVVTAEAKGESWLQRNWRPITALTFVWLVVSYFYGFVAQNLNPATIMELFALVKICLGGYTVGRTGEKIAKVIPDIVAAVKK